MLVDALDDLRRLFQRGGRDLGEHGVRVGIAGLHALDVQYGEAAEARELDREVRIDDRIHGGGEQRQRELALAERETQVHHLRVRRDGAGDDGDIVEAVDMFERLANDGLTGRRHFPDRPTQHHHSLGPPALTPRRPDTAPECTQTPAA